MAEQKSTAKGKTIASAIFWIIILVAYLAALIWLGHTKSRLYFAGCIWRVSDANQLVLIVIWITEIFRRIRNIRKTDDPELKQERIRSCRKYGIFVGILAVLFIAVIGMTFSDYRKTQFAVLGNDPNRAILLQEDEYGSFIHVYTKKGILIRPEDEVKLVIYKNSHVIRDAQYTWESDGKTVTVRFETGGLADGFGWDENAGTPAPPEIIEKVYTLPA